MKTGDRVKMTSAYKRELCQVIRGGGISHKHCVYSNGDRVWWSGQIKKYGSETAVVIGVPQNGDPFARLRFEDGDTMYVRGDGLVVVETQEEITNRNREVAIEAANKYWSSKIPETIYGLVDGVEYDPNNMAHYTKRHWNK